MHWKTEIVNGNKVTFCKQEGRAIEYMASRGVDGNFSVNTHNGVFNDVRYVGEFENYREVDRFADEIHLDIPVVCHVAHNAPTEYVLLIEKESYYIRVVE